MDPNRSVLYKLVILWVAVGQLYGKRNHKASEEKGNQLEIAAGFIILYIPSAGFDAKDATMLKSCSVAEDNGRRPGW